MPKYRVFTNDCGPSRYSCFDVIEAKSQRNAVSFATRKISHACKMVVIPDELTEQLFIAGTDPKGGQFAKRVINRYGYTLVEVGA